MIYIEGESLTITINSFHVEETYINIVSQLIDLLQLQNPDTTPPNNYYAVYELLNALMPDCRQMRAMNGVETEDTK